jgi:hypothetical protein
MSLSDAYTVDWDTPDDAKQLIPKRKGAVEPLPLVSALDARSIQRDLFDEWGLTEYRDCLTAEMASRPVPHVFERSKTAALTELYRRWGPKIISRFIPEMKAPVQAFNKVSRLGWPEFSVPDNKQPILEWHFDQVIHSGLGAYQESFILQNVRLQAEQVTKAREFNFLGRDGVYAKQVTAEERRVRLGTLGEAFASRTRGIFNMPLPNLVKQTLDTSEHNAMLEYPIFHHNMYSGGDRLSGRPFLALDVKHFDRFTSSVVQVRGEIIGGLYGEITKLFSSIPFLVPTDDWKKNAFVAVPPDTKYAVQFASGDSAVTTAQKEAFIAIYAEYFRKTRGVSDDQAIDLVLAGGDSSLSILNYGDDNFLFGEQSELDYIFSFLGDYLDVEKEEPPKFLGFEYSPDTGKFTLGVKSYLLKTYLPERSVNTQFRKYPCLGWMLKRATYEQYGTPNTFTSLFERENQLLQHYAGLSWSDVVATALKEKRAQEMNAVMQSPLVLLDKVWMLTETEKIRLGLFFGFQPEVTGPVIRKLLGAQWLPKLKF